MNFCQLIADILIYIFFKKIQMKFCLIKHA